MTITTTPAVSNMASLYPKYYKRVPDGVTALDIYAVCKMFDVTDAALSHSIKKILLPGVRTGGKSRYDDIKEARDTLNRWLELNNESSGERKTDFVADTMNRAQIQALGQLQREP